MDIEAIASSEIDGETDADMHRDSESKLITKDEEISISSRISRVLFEENFVDRARRQCCLRITFHRCSSVQNAEIRQMSGNQILIYGIIRFNDNLDNHYPRN